MRTSLSLRTANLLYLATALLVLLLGSLAQAWNLGWGLIITEVVCIGLPVLWLIRRSGLDLAETLALRPVRLPTLALGLLTGLGTWAIGALLTGVMVALTGYQAPAPASPTDPLSGIALFLGMVLFAPLCEEMLFRGYLFRVYERRGAAVAVTATALLFAFYHFRLQGLPGLIPVAFVLGILRWRTGSLLPGMALHFGHNLVAAGLSLWAIFGSGRPQPAASGEALLILMLVLLVIGTAAFGLLLRRHPEPEETAPAVSTAPAESQTTGFAWSRAWPLLLFGLIWLGLAGAEVWVGVREAFINAQRPVQVEPLGLRAAAWERETSMRYEIYNPAAEKVGTVHCRLTPETDSILLTCQESGIAWKIQTETSTFQSDAHTAETSMRWGRSDLRLQSYTKEITWTDGNGSMSIRVEPAGDELIMTSSSNLRPEEQRMTLPGEGALPDEWPWRLMAAALPERLKGEIALAWESKWSPKTRTSGPMVEPTSLTITAGTMPGDATQTEVVHINLGIGQNAWYDKAEPHLLLRFDNGMQSLRYVGP